MEHTVINDIELLNNFYHIPTNNINEQANSEIYCSVANLIALYHLITSQSSENNLLSFNIFYSPKPKHLCNIVYLLFSSLCFIDENSKFKPRYTDNAIIETDNQDGFFLNITGLLKTFPNYANILLDAYKNNLLQEQSDLSLKINTVSDQMFAKIPNNHSNINNKMYSSIAGLIAVYNLLAQSNNEKTNLTSFNIFYSPKHSSHIIYVHFSASCFIDQLSIFRPQYTDNSLIETDNQNGFFLNITGLRKIFPYDSNNLLHAYKNDLLQEKSNVSEKIDIVDNQITF